MKYNMGHGLGFKVQLHKQHCCWLFAFWWFCKISKLGEMYPYLLVACVLNSLHEMLITLQRRIGMQCNNLPNNESQYFHLYTLDIWMTIFDDLFYQNGVGNFQMRFHMTWYHFIWQCLRICMKKKYHSV